MMPFKKPKHKLLGTAQSSGNLFDIMYEMTNIVVQRLLK